MFGFIQAPCRTSAATSAAEYRKWSCGLSCALARDYTPLARFLVNHDSTFLAIAAAGTDPDESGAVIRTCCNPFSAPRPMHADSWATCYAAAVTTCALRVKAEDEVADERGIRSLLGRAAMAISTPAAGRATALLNTLGFPSSAVWEKLQARAAVETPRSGLRDAASPTAEAYREIFRFPGSHFEAAKPVRESLGTLGESMGRMVYWKDALDDREDDAKHGRYNPLEFHRESRLRERLGEEVTRFRAAAASLTGFGGLLPALADSTTEFHFSAASAERSQRKERRSKSHFCDYCCPVDCCPSCGSCSRSRKGGVGPDCCDSDCGCPCDC